MIAFLRRNPLIAGLAALCAVLAVIVIVELAALGSSPATAVSGKAAPAEAKLLPPLAAATPEDAYPETAARPLWIPTRRPAPPVAAAAQQTFARGQFILQGVTIAGGTRIALLKEKSSGRVHRVELGRDVNGLHLAEVEPERVTLTQGPEREVIDLRVQRPGGAPGAPGAPPQPAAGQPAMTPAQSAAAAAMAAGAASRGGPFAPQTQPAVPGAAPLTVPPQFPQRPPTANPVPGAVPQQSAAPMTPEELLARRRARRNQPE